MSSARLPGVTGLVGRHQWSASRLGPPEFWDTAVRAAAEIVLASPAPMALHLGDEFFLVYNDAYAALIGDKHPQALGQPAPQVFAEVWPMPGIGDVVEHTYRTGQPFLERETTMPLRPAPGQLDQAEYVRACSPVRDSRGRIVGVLSVIAETNPAIRQLQGISDLAAALSATLTLDDVARVALRYAITSFDADRVAFAVDDAGGWRMARRVRGNWWMRPTNGSPAVAAGSGGLAGPGGGQRPHRAGQLHHRRRAAAGGSRRPARPEDPGPGGRTPAGRRGTGCPHGRLPVRARLVGPGAGLAGGLGRAGRPGHRTGPPLRDPARHRPTVAAQHAAGEPAQPAPAADRGALRPGGGRQRRRWGLLRRLPAAHR